jgi:hypothetical protein
MAVQNELPLRQPIDARSNGSGSGSLVQDRPVLGRMPDASRRRAAFVLPLVDFVSSSLALAAVVAANGAQLVPAFPIGPTVLVVLSFALGFYGPQANEKTLTGGGGLAWPALRALIAAALAWTASLLTDLAAGSELALWAGFLVLDVAMRGAAAPLARRLRAPERWVVVGDEATTDRLNAYEPMREYAQIVCKVPPAKPPYTGPDRNSALEIVERHHADRVVIASSAYDDEGLNELIRTFRAVGVPVSLLPRPLDLLEAPGGRSGGLGGLSLIDIGALSAERSTKPYTGPDRRRDRRVKASVVVPAINEEKNVGEVLRRLPEGLHEVILVDGNSHDRTVEVAREARPDIRVLTQSGRGKGDALRTGFAAVTGNLIVMLDADGSADPAEIPRFVAALEDGADFAKGSRFLEGGGSADITMVRRLGNRVLSGSANVLQGTHFTDLCYGYNAFWTRCLPFISLDVPGFEVETLINLRMASAGMRIREVPSYEADRLHGESNLNTFRDGWRVLRTIVRESKPARTKRDVGEIGTATFAAAPQPSKSPAPETAA